MPSPEEILAKGQEQLQKDQEKLATAQAKLKSDQEKLKADREALKEDLKALKAGQEELVEQQKALFADPDDEAEGLTPAQEHLLNAACRAYGIAKKFVLSAGIDPVSGAAVIVTHGGRKVRFLDGDKVDSLPTKAVTGIPDVKSRKRR